MGNQRNDKGIIGRRILKSRIRRKSRSWPVRRALEAFSWFRAQVWRSDWPTEAILRVLSKSLPASHIQRPARAPNTNRHDDKESEISAGDGNKDERTDRRYDVVSIVCLSYRMLSIGSLRMTENGTAKGNDVTLLSKFSSRHSNKSNNQVSRSPWLPPVPTISTTTTYLKFCWKNKLS